MSATKLPCYYISHGGPPLLQEGQMGHQWFKQWGKSIIEEIKPKAIVVISAHWETANVISVTSFPETNPIIYDFYGFPKMYYQQTYDSKGSPELSKRIVNLLTQAGFKSELDHKRGFDHGCWVPMKVAIPEPGDLPIIQVSLTKKASYEHHIKVGQALASLRNEGILIIGSGSLVHNLRETFSIYSLDSDDVAPYVEPFETDVEKFCTKFSGEERDQKLIDLISHPLLRKAHPTDDHLVPLHIAAGAAGNDQGTKLYTGHMAALSMSAIGFGVAN